MNERRDDRSLGQLFGDLTRQLGTLVRQEIELARTEMTSRATAAGRDAAMVGIGSALLYAGFLGLMAALTAVGVAAVAVGAAIGMALPATRTERRVLGPTSERVVDQAQAAISGPLEEAEREMRKAESEAR